MLAANEMNGSEIFPSLHMAGIISKTYNNVLVCALCLLMGSHRPPLLAVWGKRLGRKLVRGRWFQLHSDGRN